MTNDIQTAFRLPSALVERLDAYAERLRQNVPGVRISRADVVRLVLGRGLDQVERELGKTYAAPRRARSG